jgi:DNA-3-methyladenine glycosylase II
MTLLTRNPNRLVCSFTLPHDYRKIDVLAFHRRDPSGLAERVNEKMMQKGLAWNGQAACLTIRFYDLLADTELAIDGEAGKNDAAKLKAMVHRMLGLNQGIEIFEQAYLRHPQLASLIAMHPGLRVPLTSTPFEALTWAITAQQISLAAALSLRRGLIRETGLKHSGELLCYPDAGRIAGLTETALRQAGFSQTKAQTLLNLSHLILKNSLPLDQWIETPPPVEEIREQLLRIRGIGPWTVNYALLRGFGWLDGSLHGDIGVRRGLQKLLGTQDKISEAQAKQWLSDFSPWRALIAVHLWAINMPAYFE